MKDKFLNILNSPGAVVQVYDQHGFVGKWIHWFHGWMCVVHRVDPISSIAESSEVDQ